MEKLGHDHIDILKIDIEGAEYQVIEYIIKHNIKIKQALVEFHGRFPQKGQRKIKVLKKAGYQIFASNEEELSKRKNSLTAIDIFWLIV